MTTENAELMNGGLSIKERLERIEAQGDRILEALQKTASRSEVIDLTIRVAALETKYAVSVSESKRTEQDIADAHEAVIDIKQGQVNINKAIRYATATIVGVLTLGDILLRFFTK